MTFIYLFLPDFRSIISSTNFKSEENTPFVFFYEDEEVIRFYKPIDSIIYSVVLNNLILPENVTFNDLKAEFKAIELSVRPDAPRFFSGEMN